MKILMVNKFLYPRGGAESYMLKLGECLKNSGHEVEYFGMYDEKNTVGNSAGLYTGNMDFHTKAADRFLYPFKIIYSAEAKRKIGKVLDSFKPDIVHMNNINFQLTPAIIYAVKKRNIPLVQTVHDYQMICPNHLLYCFEENSPCERCTKGNRLNCIRHKCIHSSAIKSIFGVTEAEIYSLLKTYKLVDLYICPSRFLERKLTDSNKLYIGKTYMLHNFIEKKGLCKEADKTNPYIVYVGRLSKEKGVGLLARTAEMLPEYEFRVAGSGPDIQELRNIPNVKLMGFLTGDALSCAISEAMALIAPSVCFENCPLSILEAHSMGVPVITMNCGGMAELVEDGVTGTLADEPNAKSIANATVRLLKDEDKYFEIRNNCKERVGNILSAEDYCRLLTEKYNELILRREQ